MKSTRLLRCRPLHGMGHEIFVDLCLRPPGPEGRVRRSECGLRPVLPTEQAVDGGYDVGEHLLNRLSPVDFEEDAALGVETEQWLCLRFEDLESARDAGLGVVAAPFPPWRVLEVDCAARPGQLAGTRRPGA